MDVTNQEHVIAAIVAAAVILFGFLFSLRKKPSTVSLSDEQLIGIISRSEKLKLSAKSIAELIREETGLSPTITDVILRLEHLVALGKIQKTEKVVSAGMAEDSHFDYQAIVTVYFL